MADINPQHRAFVEIAVEHGSRLFADVGCTFILVDIQFLDKAFATTATLQHIFRQ